MSALTIPTTATADQAETALSAWLATLPPLAPHRAALMGATLRAGGAG
jgi:hypothetical protein